MLAAAGLVLAFLLGQASAVHLLKAKAKDSDCECLNFQELYRNRNVTCGEAVEGNEHGLCDFKNWYPLLNSTLCPKFSTVDNDHTWCYVKAECKNLMGGKHVKKQFSWKTCTEGRLGDLSPKELTKKMVDMHLDHDPTMMYLMSYPVVKDFAWNDTDKFEIRVKEIKDSNRATIVCDVIGDPKKGHACNAPYTLHILNGQEVWDVPHFGMPKCVEGCPVEEVQLYALLDSRFAALSMAIR